MDLVVDYGDVCGTGLIWVFKAIASGCHADSVGLCFLRSDAAEKVGVCDLLVLWNEVSASRLDGAGAFDAFFGRAIISHYFGNEAAPFVSVASVPFGCIWSFENVLER